jgi:hypothetical protein
MEDIKKLSAEDSIMFHHTVAELITLLYMWHQHFQTQKSYHQTSIIRIKQSWCMKYPGAICYMPLTLVASNTNIIK